MNPNNIYDYRSYEYPDFDYDGTRGQWREGLWGADPAYVRFGPSHDDCPDCCQLRLQQWRKWSRDRQNARREREARKSYMCGVEMLKDLLSTPPINPAMIRKEYLMEWGAPMRVEGFSMRTSASKPKTEKATPKHRKVHDIVKKIETKQTENEKSSEHTDEVTSIIEDANAMLAAADKLTKSKVFSVSTSYDYAGRDTIVITLDKLDEEQIEAQREEHVDTTLFNGYVAAATALAANVQRSLQSVGRDLLLKATLSMHRLVGPEMGAAAGNAEAAKSAKAEEVKIAA